ncbi:hypothetical protein NT01EI_2914 [Edwardsiella ictaluri 93-146]|uniref:Uncharacterized protein n=1 Tax=Edwardsiella ictaluri (strain 93-146) TaxID=634503 RepID=C5BGB2_EDWI9|nr:hypothetical protein NT01EI_2914 [Edwardsiella ictaluri 93-146]
MPVLAYFSPSFAAFHADLYNQSANVHDDSVSAKKGVDASPPYPHNAPRNADEG